NRGRLPMQQQPLPKGGGRLVDPDGRMRDQAVPDGGRQEAHGVPGRKAAFRRDRARQGAQVEEGMLLRGGAEAVPRRGGGARVRRKAAKGRPRPLQAENQELSK